MNITQHTLQYTHLFDLLGVWIGGLAGNPRKPRDHPIRPPCTAATDVAVMTIVLCSRSVRCGDGRVVTGGCEYVAAGEGAVVTALCPTTAAEEACSWGGCMRGRRAPQCASVASTTGTARAGSALPSSLLLAMCVGYPGLV